MNNEILIGILSFFVCLGYNALNETAAELEHPLCVSERASTPRLVL